MFPGRGSIPPTPRRVTLPSTLTANGTKISARSTALSAGGRQRVERRWHLGVSVPDLPPNFRALVVAALRSGEYSQARGCLRLWPTLPKDRQRFCVAGVACDVAQQHGWGGRLGSR